MREKKMAYQEETQRWLDEAGTDEWFGQFKAALIGPEKKMTQSAFAKLCACSASNVSSLLRNGLASQAGYRVPKYIWAKAKIYLGV
jgi:hypothetical protein